MSSEVDGGMEMPPGNVGMWCEGDLRAALPPLPDDANKYSRGILTVIAGCERYPGAACLAARAGQLMGAGYTEVVTAKRAIGILLGSYPSLVVHDVREWCVGDLKKAERDSKHALCVGPGFEADNELYDALVLDVVRNVECPVLIDGGALAAFASKKARKALAVRGKRGLVTVMTPHAGEAARLCDAFGVRAESPCELAAALADATGAIMVVKGPDTYVSDGESTFCMSEGTPALAKAGTGDVLAGMIASLLAQGTDSVAAAMLGTTLHARAGIEAARLRTPTCVTPEDVIESIPQAIRSLVEG